MVRASDLLPNQHARGIDRAPFLGCASKFLQNAPISQQKGHSEIPRPPVSCILLYTSRAALARAFRRVHDLVSERAGEYIRAPAAWPLGGGNKNRSDSCSLAKVSTQ